MFDLKVLVLNFEFAMVKRDLIAYKAVWSEIDQSLKIDSKWKLYFVLSRWHRVGFKWIDFEIYCYFTFKIIFDPNKRIDKNHFVINYLNINHAMFNSFLTKINFTILQN